MLLNGRQEGAAATDRRMVILWPTLKPTTVVDMSEGFPIRALEKSVPYFPGTECILYLDWPSRIDQNGSQQLQIAQ
jgi:hypothetical protein